MDGPHVEAADRFRRFRFDGFVNRARVRIYNRAAGPIVRACDSDVLDIGCTFVAEGEGAEELLTVLGAAEYFHGDLPRRRTLRVLKRRSDVRWRDEPQQRGSEDDEAGDYGRPFYGRPFAHLRCALRLENIVELLRNLSSGNVAFGHHMFVITAPLCRSARAR